MVVALIGDCRDKTMIGLASVSEKWLQLQTFWPGRGDPGGGYSHLMRSPTLWLERELLVALQCIAEGGGSASGENQQRVNAIPDRGEGMEVQCSDSCRERGRGVV